MNEAPKKPNLGPQPSAPGQAANVIWMSCRASEACEGKYAEMTLTKQNSMHQGGGTWKRYKCTTCKGVWSFSS